MEKFITGVPGIRLRRSNNRRKAKRESYDFHFEVKVRFGETFPRVSCEAAVVLFLYFVWVICIRPGSYI